MPDTKQALQLALDALHRLHYAAYSWGFEAGKVGTHVDTTIAGNKAKTALDAAIAALQSALQQQETRASTQAVTAILVNELVEQGKFFERGDISEAEFIAAVNHHVDQFAGGMVAQQETREPVAWQVRWYYSDPADPGWGLWQPASRTEAKKLSGRVNVQVRPLYASPIPQQDADALDGRLRVWFGSMPESNGKANWTAILHKGDLFDGFTIARSEHHDRVRYEADCLRHLIGELPEKPDLMAYDANMLNPEGWKHPRADAAMRAGQEGEAHDAEGAGSCDGRRTE